MRFNPMNLAASMIVLAAFSFPAGARQDDDSFHVLDVIEGRWGWVVGEDTQSPASCAEGGVRIWLSEDRQTYYSQYPDMEAPNVAPILRVEQNWIFIQYEGEERTTGDGELVAWVLFMTSRDRFVWIREDWIGSGNSTAALERCERPNLT